MLCSAPARAQAPADPLTIDPDGERPELSRETLDAALPVRQTCRELVRLVNRQGTLWQLVREGARERDDFKEDQSLLAERWRSARASCDLGIVGLPRGWPRDVLDHELGLIGGLQNALTAVVASYLESRPIPEVNARIADYDAALTRWTEWLPRSSDFWNGVWLADGQEKTCLGDVQRSARGVSQRLWALATLAVADRSEQEITELEFVLAGLRTEHGKCAATAAEDAGERVRHDLVGKLLACYEAGLRGVRSGDDDTIRDAMNEEQRQISRLVRCRQEHADGEPTGPCRAR